MARLRSAVKSVKDAGASLAANISEATTKLSKTAPKQTPAKETAEPRATRSTRKSKMPVPKSTTKPLPVTPVKQISNEDPNKMEPAEEDTAAKEVPAKETAKKEVAKETAKVEVAKETAKEEVAKEEPRLEEKGVNTDISYPSLEKIASETAPDLAAEFRTPTRSEDKPPSMPKTPSKTPAPPTAAEASPLKSTRIPLPLSVRKVTETPKTPKTPEEQVTHYIPGSFKVPKSSIFDFKFSPDVEERGKKILEDLKVSAAAIRAQMPATPSRSSALVGAATTGKKKRFEDIHAKQFEKMDSIANHYAAKRAAAALIKTPENPQKGLKRTKSTNSINKSGGPGTPSPVKKRVDTTDTPERTAKRTKRETKAPATVSKLSSRLGTVSKASSVRNKLGATRKLPALPKPNLQPSTAVPDTPGKSTTSRIPVTPAKPTPAHAFAPNTIAPSKLSWPTAPRHDPATPRPDPPTPRTAATPRPTEPATPGKFTFSSKAPGHTSFKTLSNIHALTTARKLQTARTPFTESKKIDDPFGTKERMPGPTGTPSKSNSNIFVETCKKRKMPGEFGGENLLSSSPVLGEVGNGKLAPGGGKRLRFAEDQKDGEGTAKKARMSRLEELATPKRRTSKVGAGGTASVRKSALKGKPRWK